MKKYLIIIIIIIKIRREVGLSFPWSKMKGEICHTFEKLRKKKIIMKNKK